MDHSKKNEKIKGAIKAQIAHLLIQASFQQQLKEIEANLCELLMQLPQEPGINYVRVFSVYIYATQRRDVAGDWCDWGHILIIAFNWVVKPN
jgi:hypothetical protein